MSAHVVYAVPNVGIKPLRAIRKVKRVLQNCGCPISAIGRRDAVDTKLWPRRSPYENTRHIYDAFAEIVPTSLYDLNERVTIKFNHNDIFLGHPTFPYSPGVSGVTELSIKANPRPKFLGLITPLHCNLDVVTGHINRPFLDSVDRLVDHVDVIFGIMGEFWWDQWDKSPYLRWKEKMIRLDMGIDLAYFPRVKTQFNPPGKRGYLYIGRNDPMKGIDYLCELLKQVGDYPSAWIGSGPDIPGIKRYSANTFLSPEFMRKVALEYDFFITTGVADPNPTTILEAMAWGFPVICTEQSGYYQTDCITNVFLNDMEKSVGVLKRLQYADSEELLRMSKLGVDTVKSKYGWERFTDTILSSIPK